MKVAIVDDDPIVCSSIGTILTTTGTAEVVWTAHDGAAAVVAYARQTGCVAHRRADAGHRRP